VATPAATPVAAPAATPAPAGAAAPAARDAGPDDPRLRGVPVYPGAAFLQSFDLGAGQWLFMFGTNDLYGSVVTFYKGQIGKSTELSKNTPSIQQFDLGPFDAGRMPQRPSVIVKDFTWPDPAGYLHVSGTAETRYKTIIQVIPASK
jgi:hypothetical protein